MNTRLSIIPAVITSLSLSAAALAAEGPKASFDATYRATGSASGYTIRLISDGKGHVRNESSKPGQKIVMIMDYPAKQMITLIEAQKMAMKAAMKDGPEVNDAESARKYNAKSLGVKVVNGHPCHGWEHPIEGGKSEVWIGDDTNCVVKSETTTPQGKSGMDLITFSKANPRADLFIMPADYKLMAIPGM